MVLPWQQQQDDKKMSFFWQDGQTDKWSAVLSLKKIFWTDLEWGRGALHWTIHSLHFFFDFRTFIFFPFWYDSHPFRVDIDYKWSLPDNNNKKTKYVFLLTRRTDRQNIKQAHEAALSSAQHKKKLSRLLEWGREGQEGQEVSFLSSLKRGTN